MCPGFLKENVMKVLKIILFSFAALIVLVVLVAMIFIKTFDVNKYLPQITQQAGLTINRKVTIGHANLDLSIKGFALQLNGITISDDPQFSHENFLTLDSAYVGLDVKELLLKRSVNITQITVTNPKISIIRLPNGQLNVQTMTPAAKPQAPTVAQAASTASSAPQAQANPAAALPAIFVKSILVSHMQISYEDKNTQMPLAVTIPDGYITIDNFSLNSPFIFVVGLNAWADAKDNIIISGHCSLDLASTAVKVSNLQIKSDLSQLDLQKIKSITPMLQNIPTWPEKLAGDLSIVVPELNASAKGLQGLSLQISLSNGSVKLKELLSPVDHISLQAESDLANFTLKQMELHVGAGEIDAQANVHGITTSPAYDFRITSKSVKVEELVDQSKAPAELHGEINADFSGTGTSFDPQAMLANLKGDGNFSLNNGTIEKLNILKTILGKLDVIPGLGAILQNALETSLPANIEAELNTDTTQLTRAEGKIHVENKVINLQNADLESKLFTITAQGTVDFDLNTKIDVKTYLAQDLSAAMTQKAKPLQTLLDDQNRVYLPGTVSGKAPSIGYHLQTDYVTKKVAVFEGSQQLQKVFSKNPEVANLLNSLLKTGTH